MFERIKALFRRAPAADVGRSTPTRRGRVYHEYRVAEEPDAGGRWGWMATVYGPDGPELKYGDAATEAGARTAALDWALAAKQRIVESES
jgi:hypothetical protein